MFTDYKLRYRCIIWDWNGTLLDDTALTVNIINRLLSERGLPTISIQLYRELFSFPLKDFYSKLGFDFSKESFDVLSSSFFSAYNKQKNNLKLFADVIETLEFFKMHGVDQLLLSVLGNDYLIRSVKYFQLEKFFKEIMGADNRNANGKKEYAAIFMKKLNINTRESILIGDTIHDYEVANYIGSDCVLVSYGYNSRRLLKTCGVPIIDSLSCITTTLEAI